MSDRAGQQADHARAMVLLQEVLDIQSQALLQGDIALMRSTIALPYRRMTRDVDVIVETEADLEMEVRAFAGSLRSLSTNALIRLVTDAEFLNDTLIEGYYVTHVLHNATAMVPSYDNRIVLERIDGAWKLVEVTSNLVSQRWPLDLLRVAPEGSIRVARNSDDARRDGAQPLSLYQDFVNSLTNATMSRNFAAYIALCDLPYTSHGNNLDTMLKSPEDVRPFFDLTVDMVTGDAADTLVRSADSARFLGSDVICGYHHSRFFKAGAEAMPAIKSRMILKRTGLAWKLKHVTNAIANPTYPFIAPEPTEALPTHREIQERTKSWPTLH